MNQPEDAGSASAATLPASSANPAPAAAPDPADDLAPGTQVGEYKVVGLLGRGGMGSVYQAEQAEIGAQVAVKVLGAAHARDPALLKRFVDEARAVNKIRHPNIVDIFAFGQLPDGRQYFIMEYLQGESLSARLARGNLRAAEARRLLGQICAGLHAAHAEQIVHRDLKPDNLWIARPKHGEPFAKILDFGIAKLLEGAKPNITVTGMAMGTAHFMSPEQCRGEAVDHRTDIYALGVILYEMFSGRRPFEGASFLSVVSQQITATPVPPSQHRPLPAALEELILSCLEKDPARRPQSVRALGERLDQLLSADLPDETRAPGAPARASADTGTAPATSGPAPPRARRTGWRIWLGATAAGAVFAALMVARFSQQGSPPGAAVTRPAGISSLAVLPLTNLSHDAEQEFFADGMTDALITDLSRIRSLRVISRTSVMRYRKTEKPLREIARELNVDGVLEGSVVRAGDRVRISAQLVRAADDRQLWAQSYERPLGDILALQGAVAGDVAGQIQAQISAQEQGQLINRPATNPAAYLAYSRGRYFWNQRNEKSLQTAINYFEEALKEDPRYALAYSGLADAHFYLGYAFGHEPPHQAMPKAKAAAAQALALDDSLAEAHTSSALIKFFYDWNWPGAEREFRRAIELNPHYATAHHGLAILLAVTNRPDDSIAEARTALVSDPLSLPVNNILGDMLMHAGRFDEAIAQYRKTIELDPSFEMAQRDLGAVYELKGMAKPAFDQYMKAHAVAEESPAQNQQLRQAFARGGLEAFHKKEADFGTAQWDGWHGSLMGIAVSHARLGHNAEAMKWLEKAYAARSGLLVWIDLVLRQEAPALRSDPRYRDLVRRIGLPQ